MGGWVIALLVLHCCLNHISLADQMQTRCPQYCNCTATVLQCQGGYELDDVDLRLIPRTVHKITISDFSIRELGYNHFRWFASTLQFLAVTKSRTRTITGQALVGLTQLTTLNLNDNHIAEIPSNLFTDLSKLETLDLSQNLIDHINSDAFQNLTSSLRWLSLRHNRIRLLQPELFDSLTHLEHLDLSQNELAYILPRTFASLSRVRFIDISDNLLVTIHEDLFKSVNETTLTHLAVQRNPLECNCGLVWLREAQLGKNPSIKLVNSSQVVCANPRVFHGMSLSSVALEQMTCTPPDARIERDAPFHYHRNPVELRCHVDGEPYPSVVWTTPMGDELLDPLSGEWLDNSVSSLRSQVAYRVYATGELVTFSVRTGDGTSILSVDSLHLVAAGPYQCMAMNPGGNSTNSVNVTLTSALDAQYVPSLIVGIITIVGAIFIGTIGCSIQVCLNKCSCCASQNKLITYYDGHLFYSQSSPKCSTVEKSPQHSQQSETADTEQQDSDAESLCSMVSEGLCIEHNDPSTSSISSLPPPGELSDYNMALTAEEWDAYFREYPDDFVVESFGTSPKRSGSPERGSPRGSPSHRAHGRTLETLEGVRVRLKLRVEQIDVMRERLKLHMEKRSARMKVNMAKQKLRVNRRMQTIKETTSQSLQNIRHASKNYGQKLHMGVRTAMDNVGGQILSLKEFCGTGDLGQTISIATIMTDVDTSEETQMQRSITMV